MVGIIQLQCEGRCLLLLLRIRSVHLEILEFPVGGAYKYRGIFARFKTMRRKQNVVSDLGIQKRKLAVAMHFSEIMKLQFGNKRHTFLCILLIVFNNYCLIIAKKCVVTPKFLFGFQ